MDERITFNKTQTLDLSIVIVSFNVKDFLKNCLHSIYKHDQQISFEVIVADNNSVDGTKEMVQEVFPQVNFIHNKRNLGFSAANNQAVPEAGGKYILLLNPDTYVYENTLREMVFFMDDHPEAGVAGCRNWLDENRTYQSSNLNYLSYRYIFSLSDNPVGKFCAGRKFLSKYWTESWDLWKTDKHREVRCVVGAFMILRRKTIQDVGLMDPGFYMFCEDNDLCKRICDHGWKIYFNPKAEIVHYVGKSAGREPVLCNNYADQSLNYYVRKHYGRFGYIVYRSGLKAGRLLSKFSEKLENFSGISIFKDKSNSNFIFLSRQDSNLKWKKDERADMYLVEISQDKLFTQKVGIFTRDNLLKVPYDFLTPGRHYFWRVIPFKDGHYLNWGIEGKFSR